MTKIKDWQSITKLMRAIVQLYAFRKQNVKVLIILSFVLFAQRDLTNLHTLHPLVLRVVSLSFGIAQFSLALSLKLTDQL